MFVYLTHHVDFIRQRESWFEPLDIYYLALWWIPAGTVPTIEEAMVGLDHLRVHGESSFASRLRESSRQHLVAEIPKIGI